MSCDIWFSTKIRMAVLYILLLEIHFIDTGTFQHFMLINQNKQKQFVSHNIPVEKSQHQNGFDLNIIKIHVDFVSDGVRDKKSFPNSIQIQLMLIANLRNTKFRFDL